MDDQEKLEMVDRYLLGQMNREETEEFERLMAADQEIKAFLYSQQTLIRGMEKYQEKVEFFDMLGSIKKDKPTQKKDQDEVKSFQSGTENKSTTKIRKLRFRLAFAAGIALIVTAVLFNQGTGVNPSDLANENFTFHPDLLSNQLEASGATEDTNNELIPHLQNGIVFYNQGEYALAKTEFQQFKNQAKTKNYLVLLNDFYIAQIALYQNQPEETIRLLSPLQTERGLPIETATKWYLALAYLKNNQKSNAAKLLEDLLTNTDYGARANKILSELQ